MCQPWCQASYFLLILNNVGVGVLTPHAIGNPRITFDSPETTANSLLLTRSFTDKKKKKVDKHICCTLYICYTMYSYNKLTCDVMTSLCVLGVLVTSLVALCMGPMVLFKIYNIALNTMKNM